LVCIKINFFCFSQNLKNELGNLILLRLRGWRYIVPQFYNPNEVRTLPERYLFYKLCKLELCKLLFSSSDPSCFTVEISGFGCVGSQLRLQTIWHNCLSTNVAIICNQR
jgi:hypothetical protein